jgi:hypothetical protein
METSVEDFARCNPGGIPPPKTRRDRPATRLAAAGLMGQGSGAILPRLDGMPVECRIAGEDWREFLLAQTLTELGIADPSNWEQAGRSPSGYILATLKRRIARHNGGIIRQRFALDATISSTPDPYTNEGARPDLLYLIVSPDSAGYVVIGPTLELLATVHPRLPVSFYHLFVGAVRRWMRVYDYDDALARVEMLREWVEGEENPEQYEFPDVEGCIPPYMKEKPLEAEAVRRLADKTTDETLYGLLNAALNLESTSNKVCPAEISEETREAFMDSNPPLPALLVSFKRHDAVAACFVTLSREFGNLRWVCCEWKGCGRLTEGGRSPTGVSRPQPRPHGATPDGYDGTYAYIQGREDVRELASVSGSRPGRPTYGRNQ